MLGNDIVLLYITVATEDEAEKMAEILVQERLAACANIIDRLKSIYLWGGEIKRDSEALLLLKTKDVLVERAKARVRELHSYETPCILSIDAISLNKEYTRWLDSVLI